MCGLCVSLAVITKYDRLISFNGRCLFSHSFGCWRSDIRVPACSVSGEGLLPDLQMASFLLCSYMVEVEREGKFVWCFFL